MCAVYRIVADTNIVVSGLLWGGKPRLLLELAIAQQIVLCATEILLDELFDVVARPRFAGKLVQAGTSPAELLADYRFLVEIVIPVEIHPHVLADPDDDAVLACALAANAPASSWRT